MMRKKISMFVLGCAATPMAFAATNVRLDSYSVEKQQLLAPAEVRDANGAARSVNAMYVVRVKGLIPTNQAHPVQIFIGDTPIREYGATKDGIYFKVSDPTLLRQFHGKPFRFVTHAQPAKQSALIFNAPAE